MPTEINQHPYHHVKCLRSPILSFYFFHITRQQNQFSASLVKDPKRAVGTQSKIQLSLNYLWHSTVGKDPTTTLHGILCDIT